MTASALRASRPHQQIHAAVALARVGNGALCDCDYCVDASPPEPASLSTSQKHSSRRKFFIKLAKGLCNFFFSPPQFFPQFLNFFFCFSVFLIGDDVYSIWPTHCALHN